MEIDTFKVGDTVLICTEINRFSLVNSDLSLFSAPEARGVIKRLHQAGNNFLADVDVKVDDLEWEGAKPDSETVEILCWEKELIKV